MILLSDRIPRRFILTNSSGIRLAIGFGMVVCVFGAALLLNLHNLKKLRETTQEARIRQQIRRQVDGISETGELLYDIQQDFVASDGFDNTKVTRFGAAYGQMNAYLDGLLAQSRGPYETEQVAKLSQTARRLGENFSDEVVRIKILFVLGGATEEELAAALAFSRTALNELKGLSDDLRRILDMKANVAEFEADWLWQLSLNLSEASLGIALLVSLLVVYLTHGAIVRPINMLVEGTKTLARGDLTRRVEVPASGEFRELAESFNRMTEALQANQRQLVEAGKLATLGRFAAGTAHEINNPVAVILGYAKTMIRRLEPDAPELEGLRAIEEEAQHCENVVKGLLDVSRPAEEYAPELINPNELVSDVIGLASALQLTERVRIETSVVDQPLLMTLSRSRLRQVVLNIATNALEALEGVDDAKLRIEGYVTNDADWGHPEATLPSSAQKRFLVLRFTDNGPGIPEENLDQLSEPFFTTKSKGTGLGLTITYSIVDAHGGHIEALSKEGEGATFIVTLPLLEQA